MLAQFAFYKILGLPVIVYGGAFTLILLLVVGFLGTMIMKGKIHVSVAWHVNLARLALVLGIIHGVIGILLFI
ncbi:MAG TPA: hypothetical protein PLV72_01715 [Candidatus Magasanikbacteria bacterium]|nr:hypothetical protein [Candidatus Magasanikbacteria bacterium]